MRSLGLVFGLVLMAGLVGVAACPTAGLPVTRVDNTTAGGYVIWVQNDAACSHTTFNVVLQVPVTKLAAVAINGTAATVTGAGQVWTVKLAGAGLKPGGFLLLSVTGVAPAVPATCEALVKFVFTSPPFCR